MKISTQWEQMRPNTVLGYGVKVYMTVTSFDKREIEDYVKKLESTIGSGVVSEVTTNE